MRPSPARPREVPTYLTVHQVAARLGVHRATVYKLCDKGEMPHFRMLNIVKITPADVDAFIAKRKRA